MISKILRIMWTLCKIIGCYFEALWHIIVPQKPKDISGKIVLVTGGRRGIGKALAVEFAKHGANIVLWDINQEETDQAAEEIRSAMGVKVKAYKCDVTDRNSVKAVAALVRKDMGKVDILVNNAGVCHYSTLLDTEEKQVKSTLDVNLLSQFWTIGEFLPDMLEKKEGHIFAISSMTGVVGLPKFTAYCASKFGIRGMCDALEQELRVTYKCPGIKVSLLFPSFVKTQLASTIQKELKLNEDGAVSPEYVAKHGVAGVLRNQKLIFVPPSLSAMQYIAFLLPRRGMEMLLDKQAKSAKKDS